MGDRSYVDEYGRTIDVRPDLAKVGRERTWTGQRRCGRVHSSADCPECLRINLEQRAAQNRRRYARRRLLGGDGT